MKKISLYILSILWLCGWVIANNYEKEAEFPLNEEEIISELENSELLNNITQTQREARHQQKQHIKNQILILYEEIKDCTKKTSKKHRRQEIKTLKKQLRKINAKIAYSYYKQNF